jgi:hypothetical protein
MFTNHQNDLPESKFVISNKKFVINGLAIITVFISVVFIDFYLLPKTKTNDAITYYTVQYGGRRNGGKKAIMAYNFFTKKGHCFPTSNYLIEENDIEIKYTLLFKSVTNVKSKDKDYSENLAIGFNGMLFYCYFVLLFSIAISLKILLSKKSISENAFYNIICFNSFMLFICIYMIYVF